MSRQSIFEDVKKEREHQVKKWGGPEADATNPQYFLPLRAISFLHWACGGDAGEDAARLIWPYVDPFKEPESRKAALVKAAAMIVAELERAEYAEALNG